MALSWEQISMWNYHVTPEVSNYESLLVEPTCCLFPNYVPTRDIQYSNERFNRNPGHLRNIPEDFYKASLKTLSISK